MKSSPIIRDVRTPDDLCALLDEQIGFYRTLYVLLDRQRDRLATGQDHLLEADVADIEGLQCQIERSEAALVILATVAPEGRPDRTGSAEVAGRLDRIHDLAARCRAVVDECQRMVNERLDACRRESMAMEQCAFAFAPPEAGPSHESVPPRQTRRASGM